MPSDLRVFERGWLSSNNILCFGSDSCALIDSGYSTHAEQTLSLVAGELQGRPLDLLLNTHLHSDHCGGNAALQGKYPEMRTLIPPGHAAFVASWDPAALSYTPTGQSCSRFTFADVLLAGTTIFLGDTEWQIHAAPGHDPHSLVFFEPLSRTLISADAFWENGFGVVFPELEGDTAFAQVGATLDLIERLDPHAVIPGHGRVFNYHEKIMAKARQRLDAFIGNPTRHAHHAGKVLLKFKLLEAQQMEFSNFLAWAGQTSYFRLIRKTYFSSVPLEQWVGQLTEELIHSGVASMKEGVIFNG
ncbi:MAG TPA: MBL fold metallo-hydrolase [Polaromonas sp.]|uniref:MBL fold metallo-hydrolase n=1 Tax=Polaromonas sp. TaxID=1869339 RepID=UPI002D539C76|nr:MBL fold metallo-hydrolase [Polaromonas sp.]HYW56286.1 MBL fold metallo-hydrolase [Polaromonas sp.]